MVKPPIHWVTSTCGFGPIPSPSRVPLLQAVGVTDILYVSDARSYPDTLAAGFRSVVFIPIADCVPIEPETVTEFLIERSDLIDPWHGRPARASQSTHRGETPLPRFERHTLSLPRGWRVSEDHGLHKASDHANRRVSEYSAHPN